VAECTGDCRFNDSAETADGVHYFRRWGSQMASGRNFMTPESEARNQADAWFKRWDWLIMIGSEDCSPVRLGLTAGADQRSQAPVVDTFGIAAGCVCPQRSRSDQAVGIRLMLQWFA